MTTLNMRDAAENSRRHSLAGLEAGRRARKKLGIDELDRDASPVEVIVPDDIYVITPTFFIGMFGPSVNYLGGADGFMKQYEFDCSPLMHRQIRNRVRGVKV